MSSLNLVSPDLFMLNICDKLKDDGKVVVFLKLNKLFKNRLEWGKWCCRFNTTYTLMQQEYWSPNIRSKGKTRSVVSLIILFQFECSVSGLKPGLKITLSAWTRLETLQCSKCPLLCPGQKIWRCSLEAESAELIYMESQCNMIMYCRNVETYKNRAFAWVQSAMWLSADGSSDSLLRSKKYNINITQGALFNLSALPASTAGCFTTTSTQLVAQTYSTNISFCRLKWNLVNLGCYGTFNAQVGKNKLLMAHQWNRNHVRKQHVLCAGSVCLLLMMKSWNYEVKKWCKNDVRYYI